MPCCVQLLIISCNLSQASSKFSCSLYTKFSMFKMYSLVFMGEKYHLKKALVHQFHVVMLFSNSKHNQSHAFPLREKGKVQSLMYSVGTRFCLIVLVNLVNFLRCCIGFSWAAPPNELFVLQHRWEPMLKVKYDSLQQLGQLDAISFPQGKGEVVHKGLALIGCHCSFSFLMNFYTKFSY